MGPATGSVGQFPDADGLEPEMIVPSPKTMPNRYTATPMRRTASNTSAQRTTGRRPRSRLPRHADRRQLPGVVVPSCVAVDFGAMGSADGEVVEKHNGPLTEGQFAERIEENFLGMAALAGSG